MYPVTSYCERNADGKKLQSHSKERPLPFLRMDQTSGWPVTRVSGVPGSDRIEADTGVGKA